MVIVRESVLSKVLDAISKYGDQIVRIELTSEEFSTFLKEIERSSDDIKRKITSVSIHQVDKLSGSYVVFEGICIQTHHEYKKNGVSEKII